MKKNITSITTKHVFTKNNRIFLKREKQKSKENEWNLINFQWIPVVELSKNLKE